MDLPCSFEDLRACLRSIASVNRLTRGDRPTLQWLDELYRGMPLQTRPVHIVDVGCGYGDMLRRVHEWAAGRRLPVRLTGIDLNPDAVRAAREVTVPGTVTFLTGNALEFNPPEPIDVVLSSLLTHHLEDEQVVEFLRWMERTARLGWFVNDLHRQKVPFHAFRLLARFTTWHRFVKHDGAVSILRSFREEDWRVLCRAAGLPAEAYAIREYRPARLCVARMR